MAERYKSYSETNPSSQQSAAAPHSSTGDEDEHGEMSPSPAAARPIVGPGAGGGAAGVERLDSQVQKAQEQLIKLKREQELIEKQKRELEELSRRQDELERGKTEMIEKLTRALVIIERQTGEAQKRVEQLRATAESFTGHLRTLEAIHPKVWAQEAIPKELNRALSSVDHARSEFNQSRARLQADAINAAGTDTAADSTGGSGSTATDYDELFNEGGARPFMYWFKAGLAFTLPLLILGLVALLVVVSFALNLR